MAHDVEGHVADVLGQGVVAAADERQGPRGEDEVDRGPRARSVGDVPLQLGKPAGPRGAGSGGQADRVVEQSRIDVDPVGLPLQLDQVGRW